MDKKDIQFYNLDTSIDSIYGSDSIAFIIPEKEDFITIGTPDWINLDTEVYSSSHVGDGIKGGTWNSFFNQKKEEKPFVYDENVYNVRNLLEERMFKGYNKYGTTTMRKDIDMLGWLQHLQEELLDAAVYVERLKKECK